jgi:hypothetical protein
MAHRLMLGLRRVLHHRRPPEPFPHQDPLTLGQLLLEPILEGRGNGNLPFLRCPIITFVLPIPLVQPTLNRIGLMMIHSFLQKVLRVFKDRKEHKVIKDFKEFKEPRVRRERKGLQVHKDRKGRRELKALLARRVRKD